jgi:hypothetical protein
MKMRPIREADWPAIRDFADRHFGMSHNTNAAFNEHWFRCRGIAPEQEAELDGWAGLVIVDGDRLLGIMMFIITAAQFAGASSPMAWISTGVVDDEARAVGAGAPLYLWIYKKFPIVGALSGNALSGPINSLMGHEIPGVSMCRHLAVHDERVRGILPVEFKGDLSAVFHAGEIPAALTWNWESGLPADYNQLWEEFGRTGVFTTDRTPEHYQWRVATAPFMDYRILSIRRHKMLVGMAVVRFQETPAGVACRIIDFIAAPADAAGSFAAVAAACANAGALFSDFHVIGSIFDSALDDGGYRRPETDPALDAVPNLLSPVDHRKWTNTFNIGGQLARKNQEWRSPDGVYFTKADSDRDWPTKYELARRGIE